jgi:hypothetical protein
MNTLIKQEAERILEKHTGNVFGFHKLTEWHRKFILSAMEEYAQSLQRPGGSDGSEAVGFIDWAVMNGWRLCREHIISWANDELEKSVTTEDLYQLYKQQP